ncbi:uncharacterized protein LOC144911509 isoform X2 [Branchiostoma floridae x Branchiostoma belcheri]
MPVVDGNVDSEGEDMDQSTPDSDKSNSEESATSSASEEDDESSAGLFFCFAELDEEDCDRRRTECMADMADLERQFTDLKEQLYRERMSQIEAKLEEAKMGCAPEYVEPLTQLRINMQTRTEVADDGSKKKIACRRPLPPTRERYGGSYGLLTCPPSVGKQWGREDNPASGRQTIDVTDIISVINSC